MTTSEEHQHISRQLYGVVPIADVALLPLYDGVIYNLRRIFDCAWEGIRANMKSAADRQRPVEMSVIETTELSPVAVRGINADHIFLTTELLGRCFGLAGAIFSDPRLITHVGDPSREALCASDRLPRWPVTRAEHDARESLDGLSNPKCPRRQTASHLIALEAVAFVMLHEIGHIANGHIGRLLSRPETICGLAGVPDADLDPEIPLAVIEADADGFAARARGRMLLCGPLTEDICERIAWPGLDSLTLSLVLACIGSELVFRVVADTPLSEERLDANAYPPPPVRATTAFADLGTELVLMGAVDLTRALEVALDARAAFIVWFDSGRLRADFELFKAENTLIRDLGLQLSELKGGYEERLIAMRRYNNIWHRRDTVIWWPDQRAT